MSEKLSTPEPDTTVSVAIVYDSGSRGYAALSGRTRVLADAVGKGARMVKGTAVTLIAVADRASHWEVLDAADAIVFGCPTYMGSGSAALKAFMEETIQPQFLEQRWKYKLVAGFTNSAGMSGDKLLALLYKKNWSGANGPGSSLDSSDEAFSDADLLRECLRPGSDQKCLGGYPFHTNFTEILP